MAEITIFSIKFESVKTIKSDNLSIIKFDGSQTRKDVQTILQANALDLRINDDISFSIKDDCLIVEGKCYSPDPNDVGYLFLRG